MKAVLLAAGYGTRLYPLTESLPKALLPVGGRPILQHLEQKLTDPAVGIREAVLVSNHRFAEQFRVWAAGRTGIRWTVLDDGTTSDENRLGSMGDLAFAIRETALAEDLLVLGSDNLFEDGLSRLIAKARETQAVTLGAYELPDKNLASLYGVLSVDAQGRITRFEEKPPRPESALISTAAYFFPEPQVRLVLEYVASQTSADKLGSFIAWLVTQEPVFAVPFRGAWVDIGDRTSYKNAQEIFHA